MQVEWYGQSAFRLRADDGTTVFIDPFGDMSALAGRGVAWEYPAIKGVSADLLLVTHEHRDHNAVEAIDGEPALIRSTAGRPDSPIGQVTGVASEHDPVAGTERGPNSIYVFELDGLRVAHFGDFGQAELRPAQREAIGEVDMLFVPVGGGPTIGGAQAAALARELGAKWAVPMHYRTERIGFLEPADEFLAQFAEVDMLTAPAFDTAALADGPRAVVPAAP
jgi:L-ascorbate metabolism protein UlaG (beta-lactamase superfamily)